MSELLSMFGVQFLTPPTKFSDDRGSFAEIQRNGCAQINMSTSKRGVIRGLHFQLNPPMRKIMRVVSGRAFIVNLDLGTGHHVTYTLSGANPFEAVWAEASIARGFMALEDNTTVLYSCNCIYNPDSDESIRYNDPELGINWPVILESGYPIVSKRDREAQTLSEWRRKCLLKL